MSTPKPSPRLLINKSIVELIELFEMSKGSAAQLEELQNELQYRKTPKAVALRAKVEVAIKRPSTKPVSKQSGEEQRAGKNQSAQSNRKSPSVKSTPSVAIGSSIPESLFPLRHLSIRVPWHDNGWRGTVCEDPVGNTACLVLKNIGGKRNDSGEFENRGKSLHVLSPELWPCCIGERGHFMATFEWTRTKEHPYVETSPETHGHFSPTFLRHPAYSADAIPFRWMRKPTRWTDENRSNELDFRDRFAIDLDPTIEPTLKIDKGWIQHGRNHRALLDCFFGHIKREDSLCFFYTKRTPLADDPRRVIVGVGRVNHTGENKEYRYSIPEDEAPLRSLLWERMIQHSIRPLGEEGRDGFTGGFLLPYQQLLSHVIKNPEFDPTPLLAFAPDERREEFSYVAEHVTHDGAIGALLACASALRETAKHLKGPWDRYQKWIDAELGRIWQMRGPCPGLGAALTAFGIELGVFVAYELAKHIDENQDPWPVVAQMFKNPQKLLSATSAKQIGKEHQLAWKTLSDDRRALLMLLSRFELTPEHAELLYVTEERKAADIQISDREILANPYRIFEITRRTPLPVGMMTVDRGLFPDPVIRDKFPLPEPSRLETATDFRRVRAWTVEALEVAASEGDTLVPRDDIITTIRDLEIRPSCPVTGDLMSVAETRFSPEITVVELASSDAAFQISRLSATAKLIRETVTKRIGGKAHVVAADWLALLADKNALGPAIRGDRREKRARDEKAAALQVLAEGRFSVLIGPAGTGKTTLLATLCGHPTIASGDVLLLAPTGKARVRMEQAAKKRKLKLTAKTIAQYLMPTKDAPGRFDPQTQCYNMLGPTGPKNEVPDTVIIDEASMMTEEMLAAVLEAVAAAKRIVLVGDHRQLPPIGPGRPFMDIVRRLQASDIHSRFPRVSKGYAELTVRMRQQDKGGEAAPDVQLAAWFAGTDPGPGEDNIFSCLTAFGKNDRLQVLSWETPEECLKLLTQTLRIELALSGDADIVGFGKSLGGEEYKGSCYFHRTTEKGGVGDGPEAWQILSPIRGMPYGVTGLNRHIHKLFRAQTVLSARQRYRKTPKPLGPEELVYGDKVINIGNHRRYDVFPKEGCSRYLANGEVGIAVGQFKGKNAPYSSLPWKLEVEFTSQPGYTYGFQDRDFGDEGEPILELAYALTVHKAQGSEFGTVILVLPNPCRLLTRELLYTAITRQKNRMVILFQGNPASLRLYAGDRHSETARRLTNLFDAPKPVRIGESRYDDRLLHRTKRGDLVLSKSEVIIANELFNRGVDYEYEKELRFGKGPPRYPDFTIEDAASGLSFYWEHLGMLADLGYKARWEAKQKWYEANGIRPIEVGGGPNGTLVVTSEDQQTGLDSIEIGKIIDQLLGA